MNYTNKTISLNQLKAAKIALADAIEGTAVLAGVFETLKQISEDGICPLDAQIMSECDDMMTAMNRLLYDQQGRLKHLQAMQIVRCKSEQTAKRFASAAGTRTGSHVSQAI